MRISANSEIECTRERERLVRKYISGHKDDGIKVRSLSRWFARLRLQLEARKYAYREMKKHGHGPHSLYSSR